MMKRILLLLCLTSSILATAQTPITLDRTDFPCPTSAQCGAADSVLFTNVPIVNNGIDISMIGPSNIWNHANLTATNIGYQYFVPASTTPLVFQLIFLGSDYANPLLGTQALAGLPVSDAYEYYNYSTNNSRLEIRGFAANVTIPGQPVSFPLPGIYSSPDVLYRFPVTFGDTDSSISGYSVAIPPTGNVIATFKRNQKRVNVVDAWGNVTTPAGTFDVLRVKSSIARVDSVITGFFPIGIPTNIIEHKWIAKGKKIPVLQVNANVIAGNTTVTNVSYWGQGALSTNDFSSSSFDTKFKLYPNPASGYAIVDFEAKKSGKAIIQIISMTGAQIANFEFLIDGTGNFQEVLPLNGILTGNYLLKCTLDGASSFKKLTVQ